MITLYITQLINVLHYPAYQHYPNNNITPLPMHLTNSAPANHLPAYQVQSFKLLICTECMPIYLCCVASLMLSIFRSLHHMS